MGFSVFWSLSRYAGKEAWITFIRQLLGNVECNTSDKHAHGSIVFHDDAIKWKYIPSYWPFGRGIQRSPVNSTHKGQWRGALMFSFIRARINGWVNTREAGYLRRRHAHYDVIVMCVLDWYESDQLYPYLSELVNLRWTNHTIMGR